jgi:hypothetical protein
MERVYPTVTQNESQAESAMKIKKARNVLNYELLFLKKSFTEISKIIEKMTAAIRRGNRSNKNAA